ncbi:MAG: hypothetical protein U5L96_02260 [Owenweeksia sp.]|nr:hypothetical protein [Owenweeksia sp.]
MLNAKYFISQAENGQEIAQKNPQACGNAWFVNDIKTVADADAEMTALSNFDPKSTAIVDKRMRTTCPPKLQKPLVEAELTSYDPKEMVDKGAT